MRGIFAGLVFALVAVSGARAVEFMATPDCIFTVRSGETLRIPPGIRIEIDEAVATDRYAVCVPDGAVDVEVDMGAFDFKGSSVK